MEKYGSTGCGASILAAVKQNPRDNRDLQLSYKDVGSLREVAARIKYKFDPEDARSVWKKVRSSDQCNWADIARLNYVVRSGKPRLRFMTTYHSVAS
jgi:hypothetical protein